MIRSFSFRYGDNRGKQEWYRVEDDERNICVRIDKREAEEETFFAEVGKDFLDELEDAVKRAGIMKWDGFHDIDACLCSGDSWVLHIFYTDGQEVHAMGHSAYPHGFKVGKKEIEDIFHKFLD